MRKKWPPPQRKDARTNKEKWPPSQRKDARINKEENSCLYKEKMLETRKKSKNSGRT